MDRLDKQILTIIQQSFPICPQPFAEIARQLNTTPREVLERLQHLKQEGILRRIGATIDPRALGWHSTLCAVDLDPDRIDEYAAVVNAYDEVTHNYVRDGHPNCWFTIIAPNEQRCREIIASIQAELAAEVLDLPATRIFKIGVNFDLS